MQLTAAEKSQNRKDVLDMKLQLEAECARREQLEKELEALSSHQSEKAEVLF